MLIFITTHLTAETNGRDKIERSDVEEVDELFFDAKASARILSVSEGYLQ